MPTTTFSPQKLQTFIRAAVREELQELLDDPDFGLPLKASVVRRLAQSQRSVRAGRVHSLEEVSARLGLTV